MRIDLAIQWGVVVALASLLVTNCRTSSPPARYSRAGARNPDNIVVSAIESPPRPPVEAPTPTHAPAAKGSYWVDDAMDGPASITINLAEQKALFFKGDQLVGVSSISTGLEGYDTPTGSFRICEKDAYHRSSQYGDFVDEAGICFYKEKIKAACGPRVGWGANS